MTHRRTHIPTALALLAPLVLLAACDKAATPAPAAKGEIVATVNGKPLPKSEFDLYITSVTRQPGREVTPEQKQKMLDQFINMHLAAEEAEKAGMDKEQKVERPAGTRAPATCSPTAGLQKYLEAHPVTDAELQAGVRRPGRGDARANITRATSWSTTRRRQRRSPRISRAAPISPSSRPSARKTPPARAAATWAGSRSTRWSSRSPTR